MILASSACGIRMLPRMRLALSLPSVIIRRMVFSLNSKRSASVAILKYFWQALQPPALSAAVIVFIIVVDHGGLTLKPAAFHQLRPKTSSSVRGMK